MKFIYDDGGREQSILQGHGDSIGFQKNVGDCVCRAIAIATETSYEIVYSGLIAFVNRSRRKCGVDDGLYDAVIEPYMQRHAPTWKRTKTRFFGRPCPILCAEDLPKVDRLIVMTRNHCVAVIGGVLHDTFDCGKQLRFVHSYWRQAA